MNSLKALLLAAACLLASQLVASEPSKLPPFKEAKFSCHRLPTNVRPTSYDVRLKFPSLDSDVYEGEVDIAVDFLKSKPKGLVEWALKKIRCSQQHDENTIVLHADKRIDIQSIIVNSGPSSDDGEHRELKITKIVRDEDNQMLAIKVKDGINPSTEGTPGKISITFKGRLSADKRGVYVSIYNDRGRVFKHIVGQLQPTGARTVFPCFDEPQFRTPFSVHVSYPKGLTAYGNTEAKQVSQEGDLSSSLFAATPPMPVHMVAFVIGQFDWSPLEKVSKSRVEYEAKATKIRVITAPGKRETGHFALEVAERSLQWMERHTGIEFPLEKLDVIAIADLERDNTESWGLVFVRDTLLWIDDDAQPETKVTAAVNVAHAVVHQWFGNLISVDWWSDLWITEGVAAQFALEIARSHCGLLDSNYFLRLGTFSDVLQADEAANLHPLSPPEEKLRTSEQIYGLFDNLEFVKSASMAQMISDAFIWHEKILKKLIKEYAYKTINFEDYQRAILDDEGSKLSDEYLPNLLNTFPKFNGVPLIKCSLVSQQMSTELVTFDEARRDPRARQELELAVRVQWVSSSDDSVGHKILISNDKGYHNRLWLGPFTFVPDAPKSYLKMDYDPSFAAYHRTLYSEDIYEIIQRAIKNRHFDNMDRIQIIDDATSLVQAGLIKLERFKSLLNSYADEEHPAVILALLKATDTYRRLSPEDVSSLESNKAILSIFEKYGFKVTGEERPILQRARQVALTSLIKQGNEQVIAAALEVDRTNRAVAPSLREPVYTAVVLFGASERVDRLLYFLKCNGSFEEQINKVTALTLSKDKEVLTKVKSWLESSGLKAETTKPFLETISKTLSQ